MRSSDTALGQKLGHLRRSSVVAAAHFVPTSDPIVRREALQLSACLAL